MIAVRLASFFEPFLLQYQDYLDLEIRPDHCVMISKNELGVRSNARIVYILCIFRQFMRIKD